MTSKTITTQLSDRIRISVERARERREHDRAMSDPRIRDEHYVARSRETARGQTDCPYCV